MIVQNEHIAVKHPGSTDFRSGVLLQFSTLIRNVFACFGQIFINIDLSFLFTEGSSTLQKLKACIIVFSSPEPKAHW